MIDQKQTQCKQIVDYIRANGHITSLEAEDLFSISLNSRSATVKTRSPITRLPSQELNYE